MFTKVKRRGSSRADGGNAPPSIVSADMHIVGNVSTTGEVQVDGTVDGDIRCKVMIIGPTGSIKGEVDAITARIHGSMTGQVRAKSVFLASTARVTGDIAHESLAIEPGAIMDGHCRHITVAVAQEREAGESLMLTDSSLRRLADGPDGGVAVAS